MCVIPILPCSPFFKFPPSPACCLNLYIFCFASTFYKAAKEDEQKKLYNNKNRYHQSMCFGCVWQTIYLLNDETTNKSESNIESENPFLSSSPYFGLLMCEGLIERKTNRILLCSKEISITFFFFRQSDDIFDVYLRNIKKG